MSEELLISGARTQVPQVQNNNYDANMPPIDKHYNVGNFHKFIIESSQNFSELKTHIQQGEAERLGIRFNTWRMLLKLFSHEDTTEQKLNSIQQARESYNTLQKKFVKNDTAKRDPLQQNGMWNNYFENTELKNEIKKDVERTYQDKQFFSSLKIKTLLSNILFVWSKQNASISYRQGMNEVAASVIVVYFTECIGQKQSEEVKKEQSGDLYIKFNDVKHAEADIYVVFEKIMNDAQHMEMFRANQQRDTKKSPILVRCSKIQDVYLKVVDLKLFQYLKTLEVEFQIFLLRWIRCFFTREFHLEDSFALWDASFLEFYQSGSLILIDCIALAMISYVRDQIFEKEEGALCLQRFLKYPPMEDLRQLIATAYKYKELILNPQNYVEQPTEVEAPENQLQFHQKQDLPQQQSQQIQQPQQQAHQPAQSKKVEPIFSSSFKELKEKEEVQEKIVEQHERKTTAPKPQVILTAERHEQIMNLLDRSLSQLESNPFFKETYDDILRVKQLLH